MGVSKKAPNGKYYGRYRHNGRDYYTTRRASKAEVEDDLTLAHAAILNNTHAQHIAPTVPTINLTLGQWARQWFPTLATTGYSPNTIRSYLSHWTHYILPAYGHHQITSITGKDGENLYTRILAEGKSPTTALNVVRAFGSGMKAAAERGYISESPIRTNTLRTPPSPPQRAQALTTNQLARFIDEADDKWKAAFVLASWGAMRYGEIAALTRGDITHNTDALTVTISKAIKRSPTGKLVPGPPKSRAGYRTIVIPAPYDQIIEHHLDTYVKPEKDALIYHALSGNYIADSTLRGKLHETLKKLDLPLIRFHDLRHTGLTAYAQAGATHADLMYRAGHSTVETVMIYQHSSMQRDNELATRMVNASH